MPICRDKESREVLLSRQRWQSDSRTSFMCRRLQRCSREKWICDETVLRLINTHFPSLKGTLNFTRKNLNRALHSAAGLFNETNKLRIFVVDFQTVCPYAETKQAVKFYYRGSVGNPIPARPSCAGACKDALAKSFQLKQK